MIYINKNEFKKLKPVSLCNSGQYGKCFMYNTDVLKVFKNNVFLPKNLKKNIEEIKIMIEDNIKYQMKDVAFPKEIVKVDGYKLSYIMDYINGVRIADLIPSILNGEYDITFDELIKVYHDAINKIIMFNDIGLYLHDLSAFNSSITNNLNFGIYDTDFYNKNGNGYNIKTYNLSYLNYIFTFLFNDIYNNMKNEYKINMKDYSYLIQKLKSYDFNYSYSNPPLYVDDVLFEINKKTKEDKVSKLLMR